jgi:hypothetical protein
VGSNYFVAYISADEVTLYFDLFDAQHNLLSETTFESTVMPPGYDAYPLEHFQSLALADLNGDGKLDLIAVLNIPARTPQATDPTDGGVWTFLGNGDGTFQAGKWQLLTSRLLAVPVQSVAIADLNGDGRLRRSGGSRRCANCPAGLPQSIRRHCAGGD